MSGPRDTTIEHIEFFKVVHQLRDVGLDSDGISLIYAPGRVKTGSTYGVRITAHCGVSGVYVGGNATSYVQAVAAAPTLIGLDALEREQVYVRLKRLFRKHDGMGIGLIDIALWDLAGSFFGVSVTKLLGGFKRKIPCYASSMSGDRMGGLDSPRAFAEFAAYCKMRGYHGFKLHIWSDYNLREVIETICAVREAVGDGFAVMVDPACKLRTFLDALQVGRACDDAGVLWLEDPYIDGGVSSHGHRLLRGLIATPVVITEHIRGVEAHLNAAVDMSTDVLRMDPEYDGGLTGSMKIAHAAEALGMDVEVHATGPAHRHLVASLTNSNFYEMSLLHPCTRETGRCHEIYLDGYEDTAAAIDGEGYVAVEQGPGLGVSYDWDYISAHTVDRAVVDRM